MEVLARFSISWTLPKSELLHALSNSSSTQVKSIRTALFNQAKLEQLTSTSTILVNRRDTAIKPISTKLCDDKWVLIDCLKHHFEVPRVLLKNGKRDCATFEALKSEAGAPQSITGNSILSPNYPLLPYCHLHPAVLSQLHYNPGLMWHWKLL